MSDISKADWAEWLQHPVTRAFLQHAIEEWSGKRFETSIDKFADSRDDDRLILDQIRQIAVTRREVFRLMKWPEEEMQRLANLEQTPLAGPRPAMPLALAGQSRRGAL